MKYDLKHNGEYTLRIQRREKRIAAKQRVKAKAKRVGNIRFDRTGQYVSPFRGYDEMKGWFVDKAVKDAEHLATCSCDMCRSPRRNDWTSGKDKLTVQERREVSDA